MKKSNVLVTGVGAVIGYGIIKSIKKIPGDSINVVGIDIFLMRLVGIGVIILSKGSMLNQMSLAALFII